MRSTGTLLCLASGAAFGAMAVFGKLAYDEGATVGVAVLDTPTRQQASHAAGLRRLVLLATPDPTKWVIAHLGNAEKLALGHSPYPSVPALLADARLASVGELVRRAGGSTVRDAARFSARAWACADSAASRSICRVSAASSRPSTSDAVTRR